MLTGIVIITPQNVPGSDVPRALVRSLSALVSAAVEGVLRDMIVASALPETADLSRVADHAGCDFVTGADPAAALMAALGKARGANLFVLRPGRAPEQGYIDELAEIASGSKPALLRERASGFVTRLFPAFCPVAGVVGARADLQRAAETGAAEPAALARHLRAPLTMRHRARVLD